MARPRLLQISASAGSGKTWRLTGDYVEKLCQPVAGASREALARAAASILAVTFTNAAASEMRSRVIRRLKETALRGEPEDAERALLWLDVFLKDLSALNIRTIDSLLHQIARASALELDIAPNYTVEFNTAEALAPHVELILEEARKPGPDRDLIAKACEAVIEYGDGAGFTAKRKILGLLDAILPNILTGGFDDLASPAEIQAALARLPDTLAETAGRFLDLVDKSGIKWANKKNKNSIADYANREFQKTFSKVAQKESAVELIKGEPTWEIEEAYADFKRAASDFYCGANVLKRGLRYRPFVDLSKRAANAYMAAMLERGVALQSLVPGWAAQALDSPDGVSDALLRMGCALTHFLVDEFQDTSEEQWRVLRALVQEALAQGGSFTWVGDIKQSIYGWRGGDSRLFDAPLADAGLLAIAPKPERENLGSNWRSLPEIINHTNRFFSALADPDKLGEIAKELIGSDAPPEILDETKTRLSRAFADVEQKPGKSGEERGFVSAGIIEKSEFDDDPVASRVISLLLDDIGKRRRWSDVLILTRGNEQAAQLAAKLSEKDIPVVTENGLLLKDNALVIQSLAFLEFLDNPENDVAFWTMLRGDILASHPLAQALGGAALTEWAAGRERSRGLFRQFRRDFPEIWQSLIEPFYRRPALMTAYDTISEWYRLLETERRFPQDRTMLRRFLETLHIAEKAGNATIASFLDYWRAHGDEEKAPMPENMDAVRIMTIHKAKGLEAPVVIAPGYEFQIKNSNDPVTVEIAGLRVVAKLTKDTGEDYYRGMMLQGLEMLDLLYVALTRPREELYLLKAPKKSKIRSLSSALDIMLASAGLELPYSLGEKPLVQARRAEDGNDKSAPAGALAAGSESGFRPMAWLPRLKIRHAAISPKGLTPKQRGTIMHACLEYMNFDADPRVSAKAALRSGLSACGIAAPESERESLLEALVWLAQSAPLADWLARGSREQPMIDEEGRILRADLIVPKEWGPLVVDYKSGDPGWNDARQVQGYMRVLEKSSQYKGKPLGLIIYMDQRRFQKITADASDPAGTPLCERLPELS